MTWDTIQGVIRAVLAAVGGFVISKGFVDGGQWELIGGAVIAIATAVWSVVHNNAQAKA